MPNTLQSYIEAKYGGGGPDADRFADDEDDEVHTSQIASCQRKHYLDRREGKSTEASPYFELGRVFEVLYGAALAWERGDLDRSALFDNPPWDVPGLADRVEQDVNIAVDFGGARIPGEADWSVYREGWMDEVSERGGVDEVAMHPDGSRTVRWADGHETALGPDDETPIAQVIETKTIKEFSILGGEPKTKHWYQCYGYMLALNAPGKISYVQRNDFALRDYELERTDASDMDLEARVRRHVKNLQEDEGVPLATPVNKWSCYYCDHRDECDGSLWGK